MGVVRLAVAIGGLNGIVACAAPSSHVLTGLARPPILPSQVVVYTETPAVFEEIAILDASSKSVFSTGGPQDTDKVIARFKTEAAKLGANGVILEGFDQAQTASVGTGVGSDSYSSHGTIGLGLGGSFGIFKTSGRGRAVYVPPDSADTH